MAASSSLTTYNSELVKCIEDLREQREELNRSILKDEEEKGRIQKVRGRAGGYRTRGCMTSSPGAGSALARRHSLAAAPTTAPATPTDRSTSCRI